MFRSLMGLLGGSSERVAPSRRAPLGVESLDGRVMPSAMIADPPRDGEEIPTVTRHGSTDEIPQSHRGDVSLLVSKGSTEEIPQWPTSHPGEVSLHPSKGSKGEEIPLLVGAQPGEVTLYLSNGSLQEIPSFM